MLSKVTAWLETNQALIEQIGSLSLVILVITIVAMPIVVKKLPVDYFMKERRDPARKSSGQPVVMSILALAKNLLGILLILVGIALLVLPGQGAVTILIGLALTNFPGKYKLERRIASRPAIGKTLNKIRDLTGSPPLQFPVHQ